MSCENENGEPETSSMVLLLLGLSLVVCVGMYLVGPSVMDAIQPDGEAAPMEGRAENMPLGSPVLPVSKPT